MYLMKVVGLSRFGVLSIQNVKNYKNFAICDCFDRVYCYEKNFLVQIFNGKFVFISSRSFQQNHIILRERIRRYVRTLLWDNLVAIGGEGYLYGMVGGIGEVYNYTNSKFIYDDCEYNRKFYGKVIENNLVDYGKIELKKGRYHCVVNVSKLGERIIEELNKSGYRRIVIISCHHDDFWKKIKKLTRYRLLERRRFICEKMRYFITVNLFVPYYVGIGGNCGVTYQLRRYGLRKEAYPFDWCEVRYNRLVKVLEREFEGYLGVKLDKYSKNHDGTYLLKNGFCRFAHEVVEERGLGEFIESLGRRVKRFWKVQNPIFIRLELDDMKDYTKLIQLLDKYFENYKLIVIGRMEPINKEIIFFKYENFYDWKFNNINWDLIY